MIGILEAYVTKVFLTYQFAGMVKLVNTRDLKSLGLKNHKGSSPFTRTNYADMVQW